MLKKIRTGHLRRGDVVQIAGRRYRVRAICQVRRVGTPRGASLYQVTFVDLRSHRAAAEVFHTNKVCVVVNRPAREA